MKKLFLFILIVFIFLPIETYSKLSGRARIDSLISELSNAKQDTNHVNLLQVLSFCLYSTDPDKGIEYGKKGVELAKDLKWKKGEAGCYNSIGVNYVGGKSDYANALSYFHKALKIQEELQNKGGMASTLNNIGIIYDDQSDYPKAREYYQKALKMEEELGNKIGIARSLNNIGLIYQIQSNHPKALEYFHKAMKIEEELGNKSGIARSFNNIGLIYKNQSDYQKALDYYQKSFKIYDELGEKNWIALTLNNIGNIYFFQSDYPKALEYFNKSLKINEELGNKHGTAMSLANIGELYTILSKDSFRTNTIESKNLVSINKAINLKRGIDNLEQSIKIFEEIGELHLRSDKLEILANAYQQNGNIGKAYQAYKKHKILQDSVFNIEKEKALANLEAKMENEINAKEIEILRKENEYQKGLSYYLYLVIGLILAIMIIIFLFYRIKRKSYLQLKRQNKQIIESENDLKQLNATKDKFFSIIAHDLKGPIAGFMKLTEMMNDEYDELEDEDKRIYTETLKTSSKDLYNLLENILTWSRSQRGMIKYNPEMVSIKNLVKITISALDIQSNEKDIFLQSNIHKDAQVMIDANLTSTIIRNLVSNSIKFSNKGSKVELSSQIDDEILSIFVRDYGIGMDASTLEKLFRIDTSVSNLGTSGESGTGLGLILCKEFTEKQGGRIRAESKLGEGSTFIVELPINK